MNEQHKLKDLIIRTQNGDANAAEQLINQLSPLINRHSYQLGYEGAASDLILWILEVVHNHKPNKIWEKNTAAEAPREDDK